MIKILNFNIFLKISLDNNILNLTVCKNVTVYINIPYEINGNIDKYNTSSEYFNDICYAATSNDGTDISLKDRKKE